MTAGMERRVAKLEASRSPPSLRDLSDEQLQQMLDDLVRERLGNPNATRAELDAAHAETERMMEAMKMGEAT